MLFILVLTLLGVIAAIVIGTLWYMPTTPMGKIHMRYLGFDKLSPEAQQQKIAEAKPTMPKIYAAQMLLSALTSFAVTFIVTMSLKNGVPFSTAVGFLLINWLCFVVPTIGTHILWGNCDRSIAWQKFIFDSLNVLVTILVIASLVYVAL